MCWFADLGDLDHENPFVASSLKKWVGELVTNYSLDGLRLDTAPFVPRWFLSEFREAAGVYILGEVGTANVSFHKTYQDALGGALNFPSYFYMACAFGVQSACKLGGGLSVTFEPLASLWHSYDNAGYKDLDLLGNFVDNHDQP